MRMSQSPHHKVEHLHLLDSALWIQRGAAIKVVYAGECVILLLYKHQQIRGLTLYAVVCWHMLRLPLLQRQQAPHLQTHNSEVEQLRGWGVPSMPIYPQIGVLREEKKLQDTAQFKHVGAFGS